MIVGRRRRGAALVAMLSGGMAVLAAHDLAQSESRFDGQGSTLRAITIVDLLEFPGVDADGNGRISIPELDRAIAGVFAAVKTHLVVRTDGGAPDRVTLDAHELSDEHVLRMDIAYQFGTPPSRIEVTSTLDELLKPQHQHLVTAVAGGERRQAVLDAANRSVSMELSASRVTWPRALAVVGALGLLAARYAWLRRASRTPRV
jgi:hypothetical protein